ncbi:MAG TPA: hypothetical protein VGQ57_13110, partial [Polyangiaceae bacterium]|nr:hypothetical protein [Polyangiaceae bacterium]
MTSATGQPAPLALAASLPHWLRRLEPVLRGDYWEDVFWATVVGISAFVVGRLVAYVLIRLTRRWARM